MKEIFNVAVIGAGVVGCAIARELSKYNLKTVVLEKGSDVCSGASKANSGVVHAGFNNKVNSLKAKFCVQGNEIFEQLCRELGVPYKKTGKLVIAQSDDDIKELENLMDAGLKNGVKGLSIVDRKSLKLMEPGVEGVAALYSPNSAITSPYLLTIAYAENAAMNGVKFKFNSEVTGIDEKNGYFKIYHNGGYTQAELIVNSAGCYADKIAGMIGYTDYRIYPCRGEYVLVDKRWSHLLTRMIYHVPPKDKSVLGVHITPTVEGPILLGPTADFIDDREDTSTTMPGINQIIEEARKILPSLPAHDSITAFSGIRAKNKSKEEGGLGDYIIENRKHSHFINLIGIESPGLTASTPLAKHVTKMISEVVKLNIKEDFNPIRPAPIRLAELSHEQRAELIRREPLYGEIICRCEHVSKKEVLDAYNNILGVKTLSGLKYRARVMMGRCQGGFCTAKIVSILRNDLKKSYTEIQLKNPGSNLFTGKVREEDTDNVKRD